MSRDLNKQYFLLCPVLSEGLPNPKRFLIMKAPRKKKNIMWIPFK